MNPRRVIPALSAAAALGLCQGAAAMTLSDAIALARKSNPTLAENAARADAAEARLSQARAGRLPSLEVSAESGWGTTDLGGFFGFGRSDVRPRGAAAQVRQPLFAGGGITASIDRAREGREAARAQSAGAKTMLSAQVAQAYVTVLSAQRLEALQQLHLQQLQEIARQASLRFKAGEIPRTDLDQASARLAGAQANAARAAGDVARARAQFVQVVGVEPEALEPDPPTPPGPATVDDALSEAVRSSPTLIAAEASARAAQAGVRAAQADRLPSLALTATANTVRDQFFPGYRADGVTVGVQGRWTLFSGGMVSGRISEAHADARAADAALQAARGQVRAAVIGAWEDIRTDRAVLSAANDEAVAAASALDGARHEVRVGQKPLLALLDAQRDDLAAKAALVVAEGQAVVDGYRLVALLHGE